MDEHREGQSRMLDAMRDNPLPLALMGLGLGWLVVNGVREARQTRHGSASDYSGSRTGTGYGSAAGTGYARSVGGGAYDSSDYVGYGAAASGTGEFGEGTYGAGGYAQSSGGHAQAGLERAGATAAGMRARAAEMSQRVGEQARHLADTARQRVSRLGSRVSSMGSGMGSRMSDMGSRARSGASQIADRSAQTFREHPMMIGSMAFLVGAAIAASLPRTRREDELLGASRDEALRQARAVGEDAWERTKHVAERTVEAARESGQEAIEKVKDAARSSAAEAYESPSRAKLPGSGEEPTGSVH